VALNPLLPNTRCIEHLALLQISCVINIAIMDNNAYLPFVPLHLLSQLDKRPDLTDGRTFEPFSETVFGTVLFADISGFTKLSTKLSSEQLKIHIK
jgi:hypothetical protein